MKELKKRSGIMMRSSDFIRYMW